MWETWIWSLGSEDPLEEGMATYSSIFAWRIPMDRGASELQSMGQTVQRVRQDCPTKHSIQGQHNGWCSILSNNVNNIKSMVLSELMVQSIEAPILWLPDVKNWLIWKDPDAGKDERQEEKGMTEDERVRWCHRLGHV